MDFDHFLWFAHDLESEMRRFEKFLGMAPTAGGAHPGNGTRNALVSLGRDTYLEILAPDPGQKPDGRKRPALDALASNGLFHWVIRTDDLDRIHRAAQASNIAVIDTLDGSRKTPDGRLLEWKLLMLDWRPFGAALPFFIDWKGTQHPTRSLPPGCIWKTFHIVHPEAARLAAFFTDIDFDVDLYSADSAKLSLKIATLNGVKRLESIEPFPSGLSRFVDDEAV